MNYIEVIKRLETIANENEFIKQFKSGRESDINNLFTDGTKEYPLFWVTPDTFNINKGSIVYNLEIDIIDICLDASNANIYAEKIISDNNAILNDIITRLENNLNANNIYIETPITVTPYFQKLSEYVAGVTCTIQVVADRNNNICKV